MHLIGWLASGAGSWIAFRLIGVRVDLSAVIAIESLVGAAKSAAALVPNALGVQEAGYAALAPLFGIGPEFGGSRVSAPAARPVTSPSARRSCCISQAEAGRRAMGRAEGR